MGSFASREDVAAMQAEATWEDRAVAHSIYDYLSKTRASHGPRPAVSFQLLSGPADKSVTYSWNQLHARVTQAANMFRALGVGQNDVVAYVLPNAMETVVTLLAGAVAGIVNPVNPLLES
ncbi:MAG: AMP-binding protein, partial [Rhodobacteraceae bacterium]|nr:AMP-binding protein [Paracoccaceae bacterium]